jgi:hypothetical protein
MSLDDVLPAVQSLSRDDKFRLIQLLSQDLGHDVSGLIKPGEAYPVWSPDQAYSAAAALLEALKEDKGQSLLQAKTAIPQEPAI